MKVLSYTLITAASQERLFIAQFSSLPDIWLPPASTPTQNTEGNFTQTLLSTEFLLLESST